jgi:hypothetical protein
VFDQRVQPGRVAKAEAIVPRGEEQEMTGWRKRQVLDMAREADIKFKTDVFRSDFCDGVYEDDLERFAELVRADEREACAKVCEDEADDGTEGEWDGCCLGLARAIRARGGQ